MSVPTIPVEYRFNKMVDRLFKRAGFNPDPETSELLHAAVGVSGESGEVLDIIKKHWANNKPLDVDNLINELGDLEFYLEALRQAIGVSREEVLEVNINKLLTGKNARHKSGVYTDEAQIAQADKNGN